LQIISALLVAAGLLLAILSATDLCSFNGCSDAHQYRLFGISLPLVGALYFCILGATILLSARFSIWKPLVNLTLASGAGAELVMIHLQKNIIQAWCPLCLGIAAVVFLLCIISIFGAVIEAKGGNPMNKGKRFSRLLLLLVAAVAGFTISFVGIKKPEAAGINTSLGKQNSPVEVYIFSDWLCPICVKVEPDLEKALPQLEKKSKVFFIDKPVHQESMNFVPYHLSFLAHEKTKYLQLRKALFNLAKINKNPSLQDVQAAIAPLGVTYRQLGFMDVSQAMAKAQALATEYKVTGTPTIVVINKANRKSKKLVGGKEITVENLLKGVTSVE
jgi:protein-disulfide isomerase/uncharacterized membrane protein